MPNLEVILKGVVNGKLGCPITHNVMAVGEESQLVPAMVNMVKSYVIITKLNNDAKPQATNKMTDLAKTLSRTPLEIFIFPFV